MSPKHTKLHPSLRRVENAEASLKENISAFDQYRIRPRILVDVDNVDLSRTVFGFKVGCLTQASSPGVLISVHHAAWSLADSFPSLGT